MKYIMNNIVIVCMAMGALSLGSCNDFLDKEPLDKVTSSAYFNSDGDLSAFAIKQYDLFPKAKDVYNMGPAALGDNHTDNQADIDSKREYWEPGQWRVRENEEKTDLDQQQWRFTRIRAFNYFFEEVEPKVAAGSISGTPANINHYLGEVHFLRAYEYFTMLKRFGDFPIIESVLQDDKEVLTEASQRKPRNIVARYILSELDKATELLSNTPVGGNNRITRDAALLFKSRVALYEATFETYHQGTPRVPGESGWPGANMSYNSGFSIDLNQEIAFFTDQAMAAAKEVADNHPLTVNSGQIDPNTGQSAGWNSYFEQFCDKDLSKYSEVLMWRSFDASLNIAHASNVYFLGGGNTGLTRGFVENFLMKNGLPIYANGSGYSGNDKILDAVKVDRDERLQLFMVSEKTRKNVFLPEDSTSAFFGVPIILGTEATRMVTGYHIRKGLNYTYDSRTMGSGLTQESGQVIFRAAEAYLNYIEASCLKNNGASIDGTASQYWKEIRKRAGVDDDYQKTISATDLSKENDWAVYSGDAMVTPLMYNIRRERRSEFIAEGLRMDDLKRWRSLDKVKNYIIEGCNFWDEMYKDKAYFDEEKNESQLIPAGTPGKTPNVSSKEKSGKYLRPYQIVEKNNGLYNGYTWMKANYLDPICINHMRISATSGTDIATSPIYQNPYWPTEPNGSQLE